MVLGFGYKSLNNQNEDNDNSSLSPNPATSMGSAWTSLERRSSNNSTQDDFELEPINDRTGLTSGIRHSSPRRGSIDEEAMLGQDVSQNTHLHPPGNSPRRLRGFHNNPSLISGDSSIRVKSTPSSKLNTMKQALGRASTRVINLSGSSQSHPSTLENASMYSRRSTDILEEQDDTQIHRTRSKSSIGNLDGSIRTSTSTSFPHTTEAIPELTDESIDPPLVGKSLLFIGPDNKLRQKINQFLNKAWAELFLLLLILLNLILLMVKTSSVNGDSTVWGSHWTDYGLLVIFILYTLEITGRIVVCGLLFYPEDGEKLRKYFGKKPRTDNLHDTNPTILRKTPNLPERQSTMGPTATSINRENTTATPINRENTAPVFFNNTPGTRATTIIDFAVGRQTNVTHYIPQYLDPLIAYTPQFVAGKAQIPFLRHTFNRIDLIAVLCFWIDLILMLCGVQNIYFFKTLAAMRTLRLLNITPGSSTILHSLKKSAPLLVNIVLFIAFFFILFRYCDKGENWHGTISFDNIYSAMVPVYVLMTGQTWTDLMYRMMNSEYKWSSIYFVLVVLVMNFWILNLFVAVINEMFAKIRDDSSNNSAFKSNENKNNILSESINNFTYKAEKLISRKLEFLELIVVFAIIADLIFLSLPEYNTPPSVLAQYDRVEFWFTIGFGIDILIRFLVTLENPKDFWKSKKNLVDFFLAFITLLIQIPVIHKSHVYVYLTVFQVVRVYRPIIYVERLKALIQRVVGSWIGLLNLIFFIAFFLAVVSVMAGLLFKDVLSQPAQGEDPPAMTFQDFYVSYLGMYQLFSGENWTDILYSVMSAEAQSRQVIIATVFIIAFYSFANFVLVNMLIAIIMENFEGEAEVAKHAQQILDFAAKSGYSPEEERKFVIELTKYLKPYPKSIGIDLVQSSYIRKMRKGIARRYLLGDAELFHAAEKVPDIEYHRKGHHRRESSQKNEYGFSSHYGPLNQDEIEESENFRKFFRKSTPGYEDVDGTQETTVKPQAFYSKDSLKHRSLFIFGPKNKLRRLFQHMVSPGRRRIEGERENLMMSRPFNIFITLAIIASVCVATITTPVWRFHQSQLDSSERSIVIQITDYVFPAIFTVEFFIRVIADGFMFTPDAYLTTLWNRIDFVVLLSLYAPLVTNATHSQGYSRFFRSLKALRALRLINQSDYIKGTFHAVLVAGFPQLMDAAMLSMSLVVPFAIYGMRLFSGYMYSCNDDDQSITGIEECSGTFSGSNGLLVPRVWANPEVYSFDNFGSSFLILFEILSQEGWTGVMNSARNIKGLGLQPETDASRYYAIFFVIFNLAGGYFVTSLFVAIVIENYTKRTGTAFMTANQRRWMDLKKLLGGIKMSKAKTTPSHGKFNAACFHLVSSKRGTFPRLLTLITVMNGIVLMTEHVNSTEWEGNKNYVFLAILLFYMAEIVVRICGLGFKAFTKNGWNIYNSVISTFALVITVGRIIGITDQGLIQTQKLLLTAILFRLVPQINSLNQLFMTMAASINSIASLFGVWLVVFAVYGIMFVEIFGLTAYGPNGDLNVNFRNIGNALLIMARMSTGEGWNDLMHDFAMEKPNCVDQPDDYLASDCGSTGWAYTLFISFIIISMYIFTNMFIVVVMHNFSYVYQIAPGFSLINREEIRGFKRVWASVDTERTGYIQEKDLTRFLMRLNGIFDLKIFKEEHSIQKLQSRLETVRPNAVKLSAKDLGRDSDASNQTRKVLMLNQTSRRGTINREEAQEKEGMGVSAGKNVPRPNLAYKIDQDYNLDAFNSAIANIDTEEVRMRRRLFNFLYTETIMSMDPIPGTDSSKNKSFFHWRSRSQGSTGAGVGGISSGDYEMGGIGKAAHETQYGISFQKMLYILAHYKLVEDDQCLSIRDMLRHRQKMDRIHARVNVVCVKGVLLKMVLRQRFLKHYNAIQRIRARTDDVNSMSPEYPPGDAIEPSESAGVGSNKNIPTITHSVYSSEATSNTAVNVKKRVRISTQDSQIIPAVGSSSDTSLKSLSGADKEMIDPEQAEAMIGNLRSEWRSFITHHDLSMSGVMHDHKMELEEPFELTLNDFEKAGVSGSGVGQDDKGGVLGRDYL
ncbi:calcium channel protein [Entomortierella beljakovae]|nr:calcium channel protein [Entomortierella beljakovae]